MPKFNITLTKEELFRLFVNTSNSSSFKVIFNQVNLSREQLLFLVKLSAPIANHIINNTNDIIVIEEAFKKWQVLYEGTDFDILKLIIDKKLMSFNMIRQTEEISLYVANNYLFLALHDFHKPSEAVQKAIVDILCENDRSHQLKILVSSFGYTIKDYIDKYLTLV